jgi:hypothetical protein
VTLFNNFYTTLHFPFSSISSTKTQDPLAIHSPQSQHPPTVNPNANMLVLVAGVTGNMGQKLVTSLKTRGHQVRGLGRSSSKLQPEVRSSLEKFVEFSGFDDIPALNTAYSGVDAVICAYGMDPSIQLEGQLLLLRATERAGVKIFVAQSWNHDWSELELGQHDAYDAYVSFHHHVKMTSDIRPIYVFTGVFAETLWSTAGHGHVGPDMPFAGIR